MNFITKNLGWLLLLAFFVFMLFVISTNDNKTISNNAWSQINAELSTTGSESDLQQLVDKISVEDNVNVEEKKKINEQGEVIEDLVSNESKISNNSEWEKQWFFSRIFSRKWNEKKEDKDSNENSNVEWEESQSELSDNLVDDESSNVDKEERESLIVKATEPGTTSQNLNLQKNTSGMKTSSYPVHKYLSETLSYELPWVNLETKIGKNFEIWVHSLKINNYNFTEKLGYLMKWDILKQLSKENNYWCFEMEVLKSKIASSVWKKWFVCKKYLSETKESIEETIYDAINDNEIIQETPLFFEKTKIGDTIEVSKEGLSISDSELLVWDILDQMSEIDEDGCFTVRVHQSVVPKNLWVTWKVCVDELY